MLGGSGIAGELESERESGRAEVLGCGDVGVLGSGCLNVGGCWRWCVGAFEL